MTKAEARREVLSVTGWVCFMWRCSFHSILLHSQFWWRVMEIKNHFFSLCLLVQWSDPVWHCQTKAGKNMFVSYCFYSCMVYFTLLCVRAIWKWLNQYRSQRLWVLRTAWCLCLYVVLYLVHWGQAALGQTTHLGLPNGLCHSLLILLHECIFHSF